MPSSTPKAQRWRYSHVHDGAAAMLGAFILVWETIAESRAQNVLVAAGLGLWGITASGVLQKAADKRLERTGGS